MSHCSSCGKRVYVSKEASWAGTRREGTPFLLCRACFECYGKVWRAE